MAATMAPTKPKTAHGKQPVVAQADAPERIGTKRIIVILTCLPNRCVTAYEEGGQVFLYEQSARLDEIEDANRVAKELFMAKNVLKVDIWKVMENPPKGTVVIACRTSAGSGNGVLVGHPSAQVLNAWPHMDETQGKAWKNKAHQAAFEWAKSCMHEQPGTP